MKMDPGAFRSTRAAQVWAASLALTLVALALLIGASFLLLGYLGLVLGRGVYFAIILIAIMLGLGVGAVLRWLVKAL